MKASFTDINGPDKTATNVGTAYMITYGSGGALYAGGLALGFASGGSAFIVYGLVAAGVAAGGLLKMVANHKW